MRCVQSLSLRSGRINRSIVKRCRRNLSHSHSTLNVEHPVKLKENSLQQFRQTNVKLPSYKRKDVQPSIVHIGVGNFHRAHQAVYCDALMNESGNSDWCIAGVGLMPDDVHMQNLLAEQDFLYTVTAKDRDTTDTRIVGSIVDYVTDKLKAVDLLASRHVTLLTMTVTENGYFNTLAGELDLSHADIQRDLRGHLELPHTSLGIVVNALRKRKALGLKPFTILSCDNLVGNGSLTKKMILSFCRAAQEEGIPDDGMIDWLEDHGAFPCCMVDRITPASDPQNEIYIQEEFGIVDDCAIKCEPHLQWIIEDQFADSERPHWELVGALVVPDVKPYELMKLRLLNSTHSALAYLSFMMGHRVVHEAMADPIVSKFVAIYLNDVTPFVPSVPGVDLFQYRCDLISRFQNDEIVDQVSRLAMDGSGKMKSYVKPIVEDLINHHRADVTKNSVTDVDSIALAVAGWIHYLSGQDDENHFFHISDPEYLDNEVAMFGEDAFSTLDDSLGILSYTLDRVFGPIVHEKVFDGKSFEDKIVKHLTSLHTNGARAVLSDFVMSHSTE